VIDFGHGARVGKSSSRALEAPRHEINMLIKIVDKDIIDFGQGTQIWKKVSRHAIDTDIKKINKNMRGLGQGTQIGKEAPRHERNTVIKIID
jgi:hypothetical protein